MINALSASVYDVLRRCSRGGTVVNGELFSSSAWAVFRNNRSSSDVLGRRDSIRLGIRELPTIGVGEAVGSNMELSSPLNPGILEMELSSCETLTY